MSTVLDIALWFIAIFFTALIFRELRRIKAIMDAHTALEHARKDVERAHRLYSDKTTLDEV